MGELRSGFLAYRRIHCSMFLVYSQRFMKALVWLQERILDYRKIISPLLAVVGLLFVYHGTQKQVTLIVDNQSLQIHTHARTVRSLLAEIDIQPSPGDEIFPAIDQPLEDHQTVIFKTSSQLLLDEEGELEAARSTEGISENILAQLGLRLFPGDSVRSYGTGISATPSSDQTWRILRIDRGHSLRVKLGDGVVAFSSSAPTLGEALWEAGIEVFEGDRVNPSFNAVLDRARSVTLSQSSEYSIHVDGQTIHRRGSGDDVGEILASSGISLVGLDYAIPAVYEAPPLDGNIRVVRVVESMIVELEPVEFETVYQPADHLELDTLEVLEPGTFGVQSRTVRIRYEDEEEVSRRVEDTVIAVEPKNRVIGYGTRIVVRTLDTPQDMIEYWRAIPVYATSYSPCNLGVPWCGTLTASGKEVKRGVIGVIRSWYNLMKGWSVFVPGYGSGTFEDIGAGIAGKDWIDLGFTDENIEPWHHWTTLYFLTPIPPLDSIPWILP
jgi:uncharacterized protein YabE (DUF348 family)